MIHCKAMRVGAGRHRQLLSRGFCLVACWLFVAGAWAGCLGAGSETVVTGPFTPGDGAVYDGSDGSLLRVRVIGPAVVLSAFQEHVDALIIEYEVHPSRGNARTVIVRESIDPISGLLIRQDLLCDFETPPGCDTEYHRLFWGGQGLPGGLLGGALMGRSLSAGVLKVDIKSLIEGERQIEYNVRDVGGCFELVAPNLVEPQVRRSWLPWTVLEGPAIFCDGSPFPASFVSEMMMPPSLAEEPFPTYTRVSQRLAGVEATVATPTERPIPLPALHHPGGRFALLSDDAKVIEFTSKRAHGEALRLDEGYRTFMETNPNASIVFAQYLTGGAYTSSQGVLTENYTIWQLVAADPEGHEYDVHVEKVRTRVLDGQESISYRMGSWLGNRLDATGPWIAPDMKVMDPGQAYVFASNLFGIPVGQITHHGAKANGGVQQYSPIISEDRFWVQVGFVPPGSGNIYRPWTITTDAVAGALAAAQLSPELRTALDTPR